MPLPDWCYDSSDRDETWYFTRFHACAIETWTVDVRDIKTQELVGHLVYQADEYVYAQKDIPTWGHQLSILLYNGWADQRHPPSWATPPAKATAPWPASDIDLPEQPITLSSMPFRQAFPTSTVTAAGATGTAKTTIY
ncbi:hypothetical protein ACYF6T_39805 [Streptomyces sp. 7R007]